jgi:hypothetical protein
MPAKKKYADLKALAAAFESGELNRKHYKLIVDNDDSFLMYCGPIPKGEDKDCYRDRMTDAARDWFRGNGEGDMLDALEAAGIPCEAC